MLAGNECHIRDEVEELFLGISRIELLMQISSLLVRSNSFELSGLIQE
jgi:hypothetical protein